MPQRSAQRGVAPRPFEQQQEQWSGIGIHAVAAASIYCDRETKRREKVNSRLKAMHQPDDATD